MSADLPPWLQKLDPKSREAVKRNVSTAPPLTDRQRERLRLLFRNTQRQKTATPDFSPLGAAQKVGKEGPTNG